MFLGGGFRFGANNNNNDKFRGKKFGNNFSNDRGMNRNRGRNGGGGFKRSFDGGNRSFNGGTFKKFRQS